MADIELDLDDLHTLWEDLSRVCDQFGRSEGIGESVVDAVGHEGLTERLEDFGSSWDERREDMAKDLDTVWRGVKLVEEAFRELDLQLWQGLPDEVDRALQQPPAGSES